MITDLRVINLRGIHNAEIHVENMALIGGCNGTGKSSIMQGIAAALSGYPLLYMKPGDKPGVFTSLLTKSQGGRLVAKGQDSGSAQAANAQGMVTATWPNAEVRRDGGPGAPRASIYAAQLADICSLAPNARAAVLSDLLRAIPVRQDLDDYLSAAGYVWDPEDANNPVARTWAFIEEEGWDKAGSSFREKGARMKGQWQAVTNEPKWGRTKGGKWFPPAWEEGLDSLSTDALEADVAEARAAVEDAIATQAVSEERMEQLRATVKDAEGPFSDTWTLEDLRADIEAKTKARDDALAAHQATINAFSEMPKPEQSADEIIVSCAYCGKSNALHSKNIIDEDDGAVAQKVPALCKPAKKPTKAEATKIEKAAKKRQEALAAADEAHETNTNAQKALGFAIQALADAEGVIARRAVTLESARHALHSANLQSGEAHGTAPTETGLDAAREAQRNAEARLNTFTTWADATKHHASIERNAIFVEALEPGGVRKSKLRGALDPFHAEYLAPICKAAGWGEVTLDDAMQPYIDDQHYLTMCDSEQMCTRITIQIAVALMDNSTMVLIDRAEILDKPRLQGLFKLLLKLGPRLQSVVAMKADYPTQLFDLAALGVGQTYWVGDDKTAVPLQALEAIKGPA